MRAEGKLRQLLGGARLLAGNTIVLDLGSGVFASFSHLKRGSARVEPGQHVRRGDLLGLCGNSGNSSEPHLHFQLMDSADAVRARGIPCAFSAYEVRRGDGWEPVHDGIPQRLDRVRGA
jgi:murein DD-endopeptidase MepM/ murein hydrolase activator NlpD